MLDRTGIALLLLVGCDVRPGSRANTIPGEPLFRRPVVQACNPRAEAPRRPLRLVTWNVAVGRETSIAQVGADLVKLAPDVVLVQELDVGTRRSGNLDQAQVLGDVLGMAHAYAAAMAWDGGWFGQGIFSRFPISDVQVRRLDRPDLALEPRIGVSAWLCVGASLLRVVSFHGDSDSAEIAARNAVEVVQWVTSGIGEGAILAGDFNAEFDRRGPQAALSAGLVDVLGPFDPGPTFGGRRIDFIFADAGLARQVVTAGIGGSTASDHRPLAVDFTFPAR